MSWLYFLSYSFFLGLLLLADFLSSRTSARTLTGAGRGSRKKNIKKCGKKIVKGLGQDRAVRITIIIVVNGLIHGIAVVVASNFM